MGRDTGNLKSKEVEKLIQAGKPGKHYDGQGLRLEIKGPNKASWVARYQIDGVTRYMGLGSAKTFNLAEARERNRKLVRQRLADGVDPVATRRADRAARQADAAKAMTFAEASGLFLEQHNPKWASLTVCENAVVPGHLLERVPERACSYRFRMINSPPLLPRIERLADRYRINVDANVLETFLNCAPLHVPIGALRQ